MWMNTGPEQVRQRPTNREPAWASWEYETDEWKQFIAKDKARISRVKRKRFLLIFLAASAVSISIGTIGLLAGGFYGAICLTVVPFLWVIGIQGLWWNWLNQSKIQWYERSDAASRKVVITPSQARIGDSSVDLNGPDLALRRVWIDQKEPSILRFHMVNIRGRGITNEIWLPIPKGREEEAEQLAERFQEEIVKPTTTEAA